MRKIFVKIYFGFLIIIILLTSVFLLISFDIIRKNYEKTLVQNLVNLNHIIVHDVLPQIQSADYKKLDSIVKYLGNNINVRITIINPRGIVLADSKKNPGEMENHSDRPEVMDALAKGIGNSVRHSYTVDQDMLYVAIPLKFGNNLLGISRLSLYMKDVDNLINDLKIEILKIVVLIVLASLVLAFIFSRGITKPVKELVRVSKAVAQGDFEVKANLRSKDELRVLGDSINEMVTRIKGLFEQINQQKGQVVSIISSMKEGLVVIDNKGKIIIANDSFKMIFSKNIVVEKLYWEIIRDTTLVKTIKKMMESESAFTSQFHINDGYYLCSGSFINANKDIVLIFNDITDIKKIEEIKKAFVVNVSHELRTPLTVIKGYVETIEDNTSDSEIRKYLEIIKKHTNRLINIVKDLMTISELEERNMQPEMTNVELAGLLEGIVTSFGQKAKDKNLFLNINVAENIPTIKGDSFKLEQLFINLIDNAIKYTETGSITVNLTTNKENVVVEVIDTGIGIPDIDKDRIFERFYTVDKSHSRQMAGTGLGLSIVKHIVLLHNGKISFESTIGSGTKFSVQLPV